MCLGPRLNCECEDSTHFQQVNASLEIIGGPINHHYASVESTDHLHTYYGGFHICFDCIEKEHMGSLEFWQNVKRKEIGNESKYPR